MASFSSEQELVEAVFKWRGSEHSIKDINLAITTFGQLKAMIQLITSVLPERQKILGLSKSTAISDDTLLVCLGIKVNDSAFKFTLMGTPEEELVKLESKKESMNHGVFNDLSCDFSSSTPEWHKLQEFASTTTIYFINHPRPHKKLLVLDLDHTILHFTSKEEIASERMKRPYMDSFLSEVYPYYDIAIWSQTHWKWLEIKLTELGMLMHPHYRICFVLDKSSMFSMETGKVKPLHIIWSKYPQHWNKQNTIHVDDLERNFALNKSSGLLISPYSRPSSSSSNGSSSSSSSGPAAAQEVDIQLILLSK